MTLIKICGVRNVEFAISVAEAGVDLLGLNFVKSSRRCVEISIAREIVHAVSDYPVKVVAVVRDHSAQEIEQLCDELDITQVQLHCGRSQNEIHDLSSELHKIMVVPVTPRGDFQVDVSYLRSDKDLLLLDAEQPGSGQTYPLQKIQESSVNFPFLLAGGIHAGNGLERFNQSGAVGVDVATGIESESGVPCIQRALAFISTMRRSHHVSG